MCMCSLVRVALCVRLQVLFIESICDDKAVLEANLQHKVKSSPDFVGGVTPPPPPGPFTSPALLTSDKQWLRLNKGPGVHARAVPGGVGGFRTC